MKRISIVLALMGIFCSVPAIAQDPVPAPILPDALTWTSPPTLPALHSAWVLGNDKDAAPYLLRVRLDAGGIIPPHTHPDTRITTVLEGILYAGFGASFDAERMVAVPTGAVYVAPAGTPHFLTASGDGVLYQEAGTGPTATVFLPQ